MSVLEEKEFGKILTSVVRSAREQGNTIAGKEVEEAFASLHLNETQMKEIFSYLKSHRIGVDETPDLTADLSGEDKNALQIYLESLTFLPERSEGEKQVYIRRAMNGDKEAQRIVAEIFLPLVPDIAKLYAEQGVFLEDLIGEGNEALMRGVTLLSALEEEDEVESALSQMIMNAMEERIQEDLEAGAKGKKAADLVNEVADRARELADELRHKVSVEELMEESGWTEEKIREAIRLSGDRIEDLDSGEEQRNEGGPVLLSRFEPLLFWCGNDTQTTDGKRSGTDQTASDLQQISAGRHLS